MRGKEVREEGGEGDEGGWESVGKKGVSGMELSILDHK